MAGIISETVKSSQEQAVASWITYLNQVRLDTLIEKLNQQDINLAEALHELEKLKAFIGDPAHILGSNLTKHGEIAEHMQVNISNARRAILGLNKQYTFDGVGRTAPEDYVKDGQAIQSKFYNGAKNTILVGVKGHLETYPDFVKNGGCYEIPKDQYEEIVRLLDKYKNHRSQLSSSEFSRIKAIIEFLEKKGLTLGKDIKPTVVDYSQSQQGVASNTVNQEENDIKKTDREQRDNAYIKSRPSLKEGAKAAGVSAVFEGGVTFCITVANKRKEKSFSEFTENDWKEIGIESGKGTVKGGIRGGAIYALTNFTATPANVASAYVTAAFGIASQVKALERKEISEEDFVINCETVCLDVTVSAVASLAGQVLIPIPVLGAVIGNVAGEFIYGISKQVGTKHSQRVIERYYLEIQHLNKTLDAKFKALVEKIQDELKRFNGLEQMAFSVDINTAFSGSIKLAVAVGVDKSSILKSAGDIDAYFLN